jgi:hypothetical protein
LIHLSTAADSNRGNRSWVKIQSAGWVNIQSARTQSAHIALKLAKRAYVLETGALAFSGEAAQMRNDPAMREAYLGV